MTDRIGTMLRIEHGWGTKRVSPRLVLTRSQNPKYNDLAPKPYRHAALYFRIGRLALNCVVHNDHGNGRHKTISYWEAWGWELDSPLKFPFRKMGSYA